MSARVTPAAPPLFLSPSAGSRPRRGRASHSPAAGDERQRGVALIIAITAVAILSVMLSDMHQTTTTGYVVATTQRDNLRAEYMAKSAINLTRLLVAKEPEMRRVIAPIYQSFMNRPPPQIPVWRYADLLLQPFCNAETTRESSAGESIDFRNAQGLEELPGTCSITAMAENSKININDPLFLGGDGARRSMAMQLFALMGGYQSPSPYDPLFAREDADGLLTTREDIVSAIIDWWDEDTQRTLFDPGANTVSAAGSEDDVYQRLDDRYHIKNAPFDTIEELRLVRGVGDDFWATFVEPNPDDPHSRIVTIYGSGWVNPNEAPPEVLLARVCSFVDQQPLCTDPTQASAFIQLLGTLRQMIPVPFFTRPIDFINFLEGRGNATDLYPTIQSFLGEDNPLLFTPIQIPQDSRRQMTRTFVTSARILNIVATGEVGRSTVRINSVMNFHARWHPPAPLSGQMPGLGIFHYYRIE